MAVVHCKEITNRTADEDAERLKHYTRTFQVLTDAATDGTKSVLAHPDLPAMHDGWEARDADNVQTDTDADAIVVSRVAEQSDPNDLHNWTVTIRYAGLDDPTALPAEVEDDQVDYQVAILDDVVTGDPIINSAGDPFESGTLVDRSRGLIRVTKNVPDGDWDPIAMEDYRDTINDTVMFAAQHPPGYAIGQLKMRSITAKRVPYPGNQTFYWRVTAVMEKNRDGWGLRLRDQGYHFKLGLAKRIQILAGGLTPKGPTLLDGAGGVLPVGGVPVTLEFNGYEPADWSAIPWLEDW